MKSLLINISTTALLLLTGCAVHRGRAQVHILRPIDGYCNRPQDRVIMQGSDRYFCVPDCNDDGLADYEKIKCLGKI